VKARLLRNERPQTLHIDGWDDLPMFDQVKVAHANFAEIARVVLVKLDAVMVLATRVAATAWVLAVLPDATTARRDLSAEVTMLLESSRHFQLLLSPPMMLLALIPQLGLLDSLSWLKFTNQGSDTRCR